MLVACGLIIMAASILALIPAGAEARDSWHDWRGRRHDVDARIRIIVTANLRRALLSTSIFTVCLSLGIFVAVDWPHDDQLSLEVVTIAVAANVTIGYRRELALRRARRLVREAARHGELLIVTPPETEPRSEGETATRAKEDQAARRWRLARSRRGGRTRQT